MSKDRLQVNNSINSELVVKNLNSEPDFRAMHPNLQDIMRFYVQKFPEIYASQVDKPVTARSFIEARVTCAKYLLVHEYVQKVIENIPEGIMINLEEYANELETGLRDAINQGELLAKYIGLFSMMRVPDKTLLRTLGVYFGGETQRIFENGSLTIGKLVEQRPWVILKPMG